MDTITPDALSLTTIQDVLEDLLADYLKQKEESQRADDPFCTEYWDSACQTIYEVATALTIPLEEAVEETLRRQRQCKRHLHQPDSMTPLDTVDAKLMERIRGLYG